MIALLEFWSDSTKHASQQVRGRPFCKHRSKGPAYCGASLVGLVNTQPKWARKTWGNCLAVSIMLS